MLYCLKLKGSIAGYLQSNQREITFHRVCTLGDLIASFLNYNAGDFKNKDLLSTEYWRLAEGVCFFENALFSNNLFLSHWTPVMIGCFSQ